MKELLGKDEYEAKSVNLLVKAEVPSECTVLVLAGPDADYQQPEVEAIKKYVEADQEDISSVLSTLSSLNSERLLEEKALDLTPYGLGNPALELDVTLKDKKTEKLLIGDPTPSGNATSCLQVTRAFLQWPAITSQPSTKASTISATSACSPSTLTKSARLNFSISSR